jgi:hypothetical protein
MTAKDDALAALRTWREWRDRRDPLIRAARQAGATIAEIMAAGDCAKGTVTTVLSRPDPEGQPVKVTASDAARPYHHPNFRSATRTGPDATLEFHFISFSPFDRPPQVPACWDSADLTRADQEFISAEWEAATVEYWSAVFRHDASRQFGPAGDCRNAYLAARTALDAAYAALQSAEDNRWRSALLALAAAQDDALTTAKAWDQARRGLAIAQRTHWQNAGRDRGLTLVTVAAESGYGISDWEISEVADDYDPYAGSYPDYDGPAAADIRVSIERQRKLAKGAGEMAGDHS